MGGYLHTNSEGGGLIFTVEETASFFVCGGLFNPDTVPPAVKEEVTIDQFGCRLLPVNFIYLDLKFEEKSRSNQLSFATLKEWASSHFEIERSDKGIKDWKKIGEIQASGWKDNATEYKFID